MMKALMIGILISLLPALSWAAPNQFGLGAIIGDPTGISGEIMLDQKHSFDAALAWSGGSSSGMHVHGDYLITRPQIGYAGTMPVDIYYGIGGRLIFINKGSDKNKISIGPRAPVGVTLKTEDPNLKFFAEIALVLELTPSTDADADVGIGVRYNF